ncbi:hypothetical protein Bca4012_034756 [Brassica carinata]
MMMMLNLIAFIRRRIRKAKISGDDLTPSSNDFSSSSSSTAAIHPNPEKPIRVATFNAAMFSMAPAVPKYTNNNSTQFTDGLPLRSKSTLDRPRSILKQSPLHPNINNNMKQERFAKSRLRVSINLPTTRLAASSVSVRITPLRPALSFSGDLLHPNDADVLALQNVKADEADQMRPLSDLAAALHMNYVFAESWAPEYGNAVLSKWPIKGSNVQKIFDHTDFSCISIKFINLWGSCTSPLVSTAPALSGGMERKVFARMRTPTAVPTKLLSTIHVNSGAFLAESQTRNVLKATIDVPGSGEVEFHCTHLDHLDENWRMKQVHAIIQSTNVPHILAGALNSLDESDYSPERWTDIVKYYQEMGKPIPKAQVMRFLKSKEYTDAKDFAGECESVVVVAKGQSVQGTCKYGTRVDYILASSDSPYQFVPGSYSVLSSKGTSDHHIVKVDLVKARAVNVDEEQPKRQSQQRATTTTTIYNNPPLTKASWRTHYYKA